MSVTSPIRRRVRQDKSQPTRGESVSFRTWSFTTTQGVEWHSVIDIGRRRYRCDCPHHRYRGAFCKHLRRAAQQLVRSGGLDDSSRAALRKLLVEG